VFSRQLKALGRRGDVALAISTSGASENVLAGVRAARTAGMRTIGLVGRGGSPLEELVDLPVVVRSDTPPAIQEEQLAVEHALCAYVEEVLFGEGTESDARGKPGKIVDWDRLLPLREVWRRQGRRVVWTNGCFDLLHVGHVRSLEAARRLGDVLVVGLNGDESVRRLKGNGRPIVPVEQRAEVLAGLEVVDHIVVFDEATPESALARLQPDVHCKGADYARGGLPEAETVEAYGGSVELLPQVPGVSTTELARQLHAAER
jgi:rfaE bifunctional protein nucleotidyltransferase chain/domain